MRWNSSRSKLWLCEINLFTLNSWNFDGPEYYLHKNNRYAKLFHGYLAAVARPPARPRQLQQPACLPGAAAGQPTSLLGRGGSSACPGDGGGGRLPVKAPNAKASPVSAGMPVTRRRAAAAATAARVVVQEEERDAAIEISSDSEAGSESRSESESESEEDSESGEEVDTSDEDFVDISDSEAGDGEGSGEESEEESGAEAEQLGSDRSEAACNKIAGLLRST